MDRPPGFVFTRAKSAAVQALLLWVILLVFPGFRLPSSSAQAGSVAGTWDMTVEAPQGTGTPSISLKQEEDRITGVYRGRMGETPLEGTLKGERIRFAVTLKFQDQTIVVVYSGTVDNDSMRGTVQFGDDGSGRWTARRRSG